jgi:predicted phosphodiesterase
MKLAWLTDIHLNFLGAAEADDFFSIVRADQPDAIMLTGDIGEGRNVVPWLARLDDELKRPIYFVLGNHDFYGGSIAAVRSAVAELCRQRPNLAYLTTAETAIKLSPSIGLIGDDGWADARLGNYETSLVMMNDYRLIAELARLSKQDRWPILKQLGDQAAAHIRRLLPAALDQFPHVILATHVPPLRESCWHEGQISSDEWLPHFTCHAMGQAIMEIIRARHDCQLTVYCGHTHSPGICQPRPNVTIFTGGAIYGQPAVPEILQLA